MVDLPSIPRRIVATEAARSSVTAADAAGPYEQLGKALGAFAQTAENLSVTAAESAAHKAVTRDADGNLQVQLMPPMTGAAGVAFNRVAKQSFAIQLEQEARTKIQEARLQHDGNPEGFKAWSDEYVTALVAKQPEPALQDAVKNSIGRIASQTYDGLLAQRHTLDLRRANEATNAKLTSLADEMEVLARNGGADTPDFAERKKDFDALLAEKVKNPAFAFPKEKADLFSDEVMTRAYGAAILDRTEAIYRAQGFDAARQHLRDAADRLGVKIKSTDKIVRQGLSWLRSEEAGFRGERDAISREWSAAKPQAETLPRETLLDMQERARAVGAARVEQDIAVRVAALDTVAALRGLPASERVAIATTGKINLPLVDRITAAESSNNPNAAAATSSALGAGQFVKGTWLDMMQRYRPDLTAGRSEAQILELRRDKDLSREMVGRYAEENGRALQDAGVPVNDATLYLSHFLGAGDAVKVLKADPNARLAGMVAPQSIEANKAVFDKAPTAGALLAWAGRKVGVGEADLTQSREGIVAIGMLKKELAKDTDRRIADLTTAVGRQEFPDPGEVTALQSLVHNVGTPEQQRKVAELGAIAEMGAKFKTLPAAQRQAVVSAWLEKGKAGAPQFERTLAASLATADGAISSAYKEDRYGAAYRYSEGVSTLPPIDWSNPNAAASILKAKVAQQNQINADQDLTPGSVLRPGEAAALKTTLTQGDGQLGGAILGQLSQLPPEMARATLADKPVREALDGMVRSYDPVKMNVAMTTLDQLWRSDPVGFSHNFGDDTLKRLQTWQARRDSLTPQQMAEFFQRADDPAQRTARKALLDDADEKLKKLTPAEVATALGGSWPVTPGIVARNVTGSDPLPPADPLAAATLTAEFRSLVRDRYAETGDIDKAKQAAGEAIKTVWGPSALTGNALMRYPPERYYPAVGGSYDWMTKDLEASIEKAVGKPRRGDTAQVSGVGAVSAPENWSYKLLSDTRTETDIKSGQAPSYVVQVVDAATGKIDIPLGADGRPLRYRFDPSAAQTEARADFRARHEGIARGRAQMQDEAAENVRRMQAPMQKLGGG